MADELIIVEDAETPTNSQYPHVGRIHIDPFPYTGLDSTHWEDLYWARKRAAGAPQVCVNKLNSPFWAIGTGITGGNFIDYGTVSYWSCNEKRHTTTISSGSMFPVLPSGDYVYDMFTFADGDGNFYIVGLDRRNPPSNTNGETIEVRRIDINGNLLTQSIDATSLIPTTLPGGGGGTVESIRGYGALPQQSGFLVTFNVIWEDIGSGADNEGVLVNVSSGLVASGGHVLDRVFPSGPTGSIPYALSNNNPLPDGYAGITFDDTSNYKWQVVESDGTVSSATVGTVGGLAAGGELLFDNSGFAYLRTSAGYYKWTVGASTIATLPHFATLGEANFWAVSSDADRFIFIKNTATGIWSYKVTDASATVLIDSTIAGSHYTPNATSIISPHSQGTPKFSHQGLTDYNYFDHYGQTTHDNRFVFPTVESLPVSGNPVTYLRKYSPDNIVSTEPIGTIGASFTGPRQLPYHIKGQLPHFDYTNWG